VCSVNDYFAPLLNREISMLLQALREEVLEANLELVRRRLVLYTFGNASGLSRQDQLVVIKPSGVPYEAMKPEDLVVTDLDGKIVEGNLKPSSDLPTHLVLYKAFPAIGGITHTHSEYAAAWAQAHRPIPCFGTTHADYFCNR
jgi:L-ribulose-5-phosphate 4-epimerase